MSNFVEHKRYIACLQATKNELNKSLFKYQTDMLPEKLDKLKKKLEEQIGLEENDSKKNYYKYLLDVVLEHNDKVKKISDNILSLKNDIESLHSELL